MNLDQLVKQRLEELNLSNTRIKIAQELEQFLCGTLFIDNDNNLEVEVENCFNCFRVQITYNVVNFWWNFMYLKKDEIHCVREFETYKFKDYKQIIDKIKSIISNAEIVDQELILGEIKDKMFLEGLAGESNFGGGVFE